MNPVREILTAWFAHVCGQGRCFLVEGAALPVCQRCLGLYLGAGLTILWLLAGRAWRRPLPGTVVLAIHVAALLAALAGGLHLLDAGPRWRLACGLLTGHVTACWLVMGLCVLKNKDRHQFPGRKSGDCPCFLAGMAGVVGMAVVPWASFPLAWECLAVGAAASAAALGVVGVAAVGVLVARGVRRYNPASVPAGQEEA